MEQIDVVKKGSMSWLWIVIAIAAVAMLLWAMMGRNNTHSTTGQLFDPGAGHTAVERLLTV